MFLPSSLASLSWNGTRVGPTAAVERAHSDRARSGSKGSARVSFHPFHRGGSASKKGTWPLPHTSSEGARCASKGSNLLALLSPLMASCPPLGGAHGAFARIRRFRAYLSWTVPRESDRLVFEA